MSFIIPTPSTTLDVTLDDNAKIRLRRHGNPDGLRLLITHGNGFATDAYFPFWQHLLGKYDLIVFDFRNHGQNIPVEPPNHNYSQFCQDLERVFQALRAEFGNKKTVGIFHSMSGRAAMKHAIEIGWRCDALVLFDPPNVPPETHPQYEAMRVFETKLAAWAMGRRRQFATEEELAADFRASRASSRWVPGAHELMARSVLRRNPEGDGYVLVCAPQNEAAIYSEALRLNLWPRASAFGGPVKLIGADPNLHGAPPTAAANRALAVENGYNYCSIEGAGHLLQIERPKECVAAVEDFIAECKLS